MPKYEIKTVVTGADPAVQEMKKLGDATEKAAAQTEKAAGGSKKLFSAVKELGREVPILGAAFHLLHNPIVAISIIGTSLYKIVKNLNDAYYETAKGIDEAAGKVRNTSGAYTDAKQAAEELATAQERLKTATDNAKQAFDEENKAIDRQFDLSEDLLTAQKEVALSKATTPQEKDLVEQQFADSGFNLQLRRSKDKTTLINQEIARQRARQFEAKAGIPDEEKLQAALNAARGASSAEAEAQRENREAFLDVAAITAVTSKGGALPGQFERALGLEAKFGSTAGAAKASQARLAASRGALEAARRIRVNAFAELPPGVGDDESLAQFIQSRSATATSTIQGAGQRISELQRTQQDIFLRGQGAAQVQDIKAETGATLQSFKAFLKAMREIAVENEKIMRSQSQSAR